MGSFDAASLRQKDAGTAGGADRPLPALASPRVAEEYGTGPYVVLLPDGSSVTVRIVLVRERTPGGDRRRLPDRGPRRSAARHGAYDDPAADR